MVSATPNLPTSNVSSTSSIALSGIKKPDPMRLEVDTLLQSIGRSPESIPLIFEALSGQELLSIARHDLVNGQSLIYRPIKNLSELSNKYSPMNLVAIQTPSNVIFNNFSIKLSDKVPDSGTGPHGEIVYIEQDTKNLIINVFNLAADEQVEVQVMSSGSIQDGTMYVEESQ